MNLNQTKRSERMRNAKLKGTHSKQEWSDMKFFFNNTCVKCKGASGLANVERDHIIPVYQGGSDSIKNIQPLCAKCNAQKGNEMVDYRLSFCLSNNLVLPENWTK